MDNVLNPMVRDVLAWIFRQGLLALGAYLVNQGMLTNQEVEKMAAGGVLMLVALASMAYSIFLKRQKFLAGLAAPQGTTENQVLKLIADKNVGTPPVTKQKDRVPYLDIRDAQGVRVNPQG